VFHISIWGYWSFFWGK